MADMTVVVRESLRRPILDAERSLGEWAGFRGQLQEHHDAIYEAVVAGDGQWAADLVESHIGRRTRSYDRARLTVGPARRGRR